MSLLIGVLVMILAAIKSQEPELEYVAFIVFCMGLIIIITGMCQ
jgi:hypothetical protein